jgi:Na+/alanine symporter
MVHDQLEQNLRFLHVIYILYSLYVISTEYSSISLMISLILDSI